MPKSYWWGWVVAHVILVLALGPNPSFSLFWGTFIQLGGPLGQGPGLGLGPGLDNNYDNFQPLCAAGVLPQPGPGPHSQAAQEE